MKKYMIWSPVSFGENEEDAIVIQGVDEYSAAAEWADKKCDTDSCLYESFIGISVDVAVKGVECGTVFSFKVIGEPTVEFSAYKDKEI